MVEPFNILPDDVPVMPPRFRLQWEQTQDAHVLLYPEGMVRLSESAAHILKLVNGTASVSAIVQQLEYIFPGADLKSDVLEFLSIARQRGWIVIETTQ